MEHNKPVIQPESKLWTSNFILVSIINMFIFTGFYMINISMPIYVASLGAPDSVIGLVTSIVTVSAIIIRVFTGVLLDRFSRKVVLIAGIGLMGAATVAYAAFPIISVILLLRLVHGAGWGLSSTATSTIAADAIPKKRFAEGIGYFALASSLAMAIAPAMAIAIVQSTGITLVLIIVTVITVLSVALSIFEHSPKVEKTKVKNKLKLSNLFDKKALLPSSMIMLFSSAIAAITTFIALHAKEQNVENISLYFVVYAIVTIISRPIIGKVIDKVGFYLPAILSAAGVLITLVLIAFSNSIIMFAVAGIFGGLGIGTGMGTLQTMAVSSVPAERRGVATSTFLFGLDAGIALGAIVAGVLAGAFGYSMMYFAMAAFPAIAFIAFIVIGKEKMASYAVK